MNRFYVVAYALLFLLPCLVCSRAPDFSIRRIPSSRSPNFIHRGGVRPPNPLYWWDAPLYRSSLISHLSSLAPLESAHAARSKHPVAQPT